MHLFLNYDYLPSSVTFSKNFRIIRKYSLVKYKIHASDSNGKVDLQKYD